MVYLKNYKKILEAQYEKNPIELKELRNKAEATNRKR